MVLIMIYHSKYRDISNSVMDCHATGDHPIINDTCCVNSCITPQAAQTLFVIYIRDSIVLRFEPF